jgi:hypothetical protein
MWRITNSINYKYRYLLLSAAQEYVFASITQSAIKEYSAENQSATVYIIMWKNEEMNRT